MKRRYLNALVFLLILTAVSLPAVPRFLIILNPQTGENGIEMKGWGQYLSEKEIFEWAASRKMEIIQDAPPLIDRKAFFVGQYGSDIIFNVTDITQKYYLFIDFVRFSKRSRHHYDSVLTVRVMPLKPGSTVFFETGLNSDMLKENKPFIFEVPLAVSSLGPFRVNFREKSRIKGYWGIWDMILSTESELPETLEPEKNEMDINKKIF